MPNPDQKSVGTWIAKERKRRDLSREKVAQGIGVSAKTIERWEAGPTEPRLNDMAKLERFFGITAPRQVLESLDKTVPRGTPEPTVEGFGTSLPVLAKALEREMTRALATDEELDYIESVVTPLILRVYERRNSVVHGSDVQGATDDRPAHLRLAEKAGTDYVGTHRQAKAPETKPAAKSTAGERDKTKGRR